METPIEIVQLHSLSKSTNSTKDVPEKKQPQFSKKEISHYDKQHDKAVFKTPLSENQWAETQTKTCSKCSIEKKLTEFSGNTSGTDAFDKHGHRYRRPECTKCSKNVSKGKAEAKKKAKDMNISYAAPEGTLCGICNKASYSGNGIVFDHCHETNLFRGYCCNSCNRSIGVLGDNVDGLLKALNYLLKNEKCNIIQNEDGELVKTSSDGELLKTSSDGKLLKTSSDGGLLKTSSDGELLKTY